MVKWAARFAIALSSSVPGLRLKAVNVRYTEDIVCDGFNGSGRPSSEMCMTDGCGLANRAFTRALNARLSFLRAEPTAIQCRIAGSKGLQCLYELPASDVEEEPVVALSPSQKKIRYTSGPLEAGIIPAGANPSLLTVDVRRASRMTTPTKHSVEAMANLAENGVPHARFCELFEEGL
ncbi:RNA-dependent RNA polymerase [Trametes gibbosa]|nr:RNA-dependent RNA polymerase [Trametes gibbosa]